MKLKLSQLKQIIKEEVENAMAGGTDANVGSTLNAMADIVNSLYTLERAPSPIPGTEGARGAKTLDLLAARPGRYGQPTWNPSPEACAGDAQAKDLCDLRANLESSASWADLSPKAKRDAVAKSTVKRGDPFTFLLGFVTHGDQLM
jgi:hypothetical protein